MTLVMRGIVDEDIHGPNCIPDAVNGTPESPDIPEVHMLEAHRMPLEESSLSSASEGSFAISMKATLHFWPAKRLTIASPMPDRHP